MPATDSPPHAENGERPPTEVRLMALEARLTALQVDLAVIRASFATKEDIQRVLTLLYEHKIEFQAAMAKQREDLHKSLMSHMWKLYGFASLMLGGVYFIARYVH
ncbi:hypothetical protein [Duganella levis]|jgi:hypothetical protein|uniref:Transmembrane protein n=1 Tax=Duganella levis TaxID=2692169 RepID=A0ABW9W932_9BURK|nr:hypothetical protein [Duganella levis]MYN29985.1 hypothetical protein [Duganella levis]